MALIAFIQEQQAMLEKLERSNLFIVPLDNERRWYRYHHLFADLLRQRLHQSTASSTRDERDGVAELHRRASQWYEDNGLVEEVQKPAPQDVARLPSMWLFLNMI